MGRIAALGIGIVTLTSGAVVPAVADSSEGVAQTRQAQSGSGDATGVQLAKGKLHLYKHTYFKGAHIALSKTDKKLKNNGWAGGNADNAVSSVQNKTSRSVTLWDRSGKDCNGPHIKIPAHSEQKKLGKMNDKTSCVIFH
ncbi:peptidase inhibitor family I36 protein [Streptomyces sp. Ac-502]|uniref:peptidase inhibitor family I36 protein n=1 Tax=Streptomyces sp. Ac-502 TaxID=3342801 RepID=UPI00386247BD